MREEARFGEESPAVQAHLSMLQSVIQRMAANSGSCKTWCVTLVSAILVVVADKGKPSYALIAAVPTVSFLVLDAYYLALERCFRASHNDFVKKLHAGRVVSEDIYAVVPRKSILVSFFGSTLSFSVWPFYATLSVMIWFTQRVAIR